MKILLDECVTRKLKQSLTEFEVKTVKEMGFSGLKNGALLNEAQNAGFDILLSVDKNMNAQQNTSKYEIAIVVLDVLKSGIKYFEKLIPVFISRINDFKNGKYYFIERE